MSHLNSFSISRWIISIIISLQSYTVNAQIDAKHKFSIDSIVKVNMDSRRVVGMSIGIVKNGEIYYCQGYGTKKLGVNDPVDSLTNFHTASVSKLFVATAIMQLAEQGKINVDAKLLDYIPITELKDERLRKVTIRQMLTHSSGLPDVKNYHWSSPKNDSTALGNYAKKCLQDSKLLFEPGTDVAYSNIAFDILGYVIETVSKQPFDKYEFDHVLFEAGMVNSNFDYHKISEVRRSSPHSIRFGSAKLSKLYPYNREHGPSSTLNSCASDMCRWMIGVLRIHNDSQSFSGKIIKPETLRSMWHANSYFDQSTFMGLGWIGAYTRLGECMLHPGNDIGYCSTLCIYPDHNVGIVVLMNGDYGDDYITEKMPLDLALCIIDE